MEENWIWILWKSTIRTRNESLSYFCCSARAGPPASIMYNGSYIMSTQVAGDVHWWFRLNAVHLLNTVLTYLHSPKGYLLSPYIFIWNSPSVRILRTTRASISPRLCVPSFTFGETFPCRVGIVNDRKTTEMADGSKLLIRPLAWLSALCRLHYSAGAPAVTNLFFL